MRIIAGRLKGRGIKAPPGKGTRPLLSRLRQSLFDILSPRLPDAEVLDCFAGTGIFGFEALSRGAAGVTAIELDSRAARIIEGNARGLGLGAAYALRRGDARHVVGDLHREGRTFSVIFVAPPYHQGLAGEMLPLIDQTDLVPPEGIVVVQYDRAEVPQAPMMLERLACADQRDYGRTHFHFYTRIVE